MIEPPKSLVRICDLKPGDEFILWGKEKRVTSVNGKVRFVDTGMYKHGYPGMIGAKSKQLVEFIGSGSVKMNKVPCDAPVTDINTDEHD